MRGCALSILYCRIGFATDANGTGRYSFTDGQINCLANLTQMPIHICIGKPQHLDSKHLQMVCTFRIPAYTLRIIMLRTIQFHNK